MKVLWAGHKWITRAFWFFALALHLAVAQSPITLQYFYDDIGQLTKVIDSAGNEIDYVYDAVGNQTQIKRSAAPAPGTLSILNFTPQTGPAGATVTIQGQGFSSTLTSNVVKFNGVTATVASATQSTLTAIVPATATTGPISVTVAGTTATSSSSFTFIPVPAILSVNPKSVVSSSAAINIPNFQIAGVNLTGSTFTFAPAFTPAAVTINSVTINPGGTSATMSLTVAPGQSGTFALIATNAAGSSILLAGPSNSLNILGPDGDADGDGLTNAVEIAIGTDPLNPQTSGVGLPDGWQVFYGINPLDPSVAGKDYDNSGLTVLQDYQMGLSPRNPNRVAPIVSQVTPLNGAGNVFVNDVVVVRFAEPLLTGVTLNGAQTAITNLLGANSTVPASSQAIAAQTLQAYLNRTCCGTSVVSGTVSLIGSRGGVEGTVAASSDGLSVTFAPSQPLVSNATYTVQSQGLRDSAGNLMAQVFQSTFTTGSSVDGTPPQISRTDPANNATGVPTNAQYTVQFTKTIDPSSLTTTSFKVVDNTTNLAMPGIIQVNADGVTTAFVPQQPLPIGRSFTVTLSTAIKDTGGNNLPANVSYTFTTGFGPEASAPHLMATSPGNGQSGIPVEALIALVFNEPLNVTTVVPNIQVSAGGQAVPVLVALSNGDQRVTITPAQGLTPNVQYTVSVGAGITDLAGMGLDNPGSFSFQASSVVDKTQLSVSSVSPTNGSVGVPINSAILIGFNKQADITTISTSSILLYPAAVGLAVVLPGTVAVSADGLSASFTPSAALQGNTQYGVYLAGITDLLGQGLAQNGGTVSTFTTGVGTQTGPLTVTSVTPPSGATGVAVNAVIEVQASAPVSVVSVGSSALTLKAGSSAVAGTVTVSGSLLRFTPAAPLTVSTAYTLTASGFTDLAGNAVTAFTSGFTTSASSVPVTTPLTVSSVTPANAATNVPVATTVVVTYSAAVNPLTVSVSTLEVVANGAVVAGTYAVNGAVVTFTPLTPLPGSTVVTVYAGGYGVTDLAGNGGSTQTHTSFTTAAVADTTPPTVLSVTPSSGATGVGPNGQIVITFSKSMNPATLTPTTAGYYNNITLLANVSRLTFNLSVSADNRTVTLSNFTLPVSTAITVVLSNAVQDLSGNALAAYQSGFTTAASFDTSKPSVVNQRPGNGTGGVQISTGSVVLFMNEAMNAGTVPGALHISQNGQLVTGTVSLIDSGQVIVFTPTTAWQYGALVQVFLDTTAQGTNGNAAFSYQGSFSTVGNPATTAPSIVNDPLLNASGVPTNAVVEIGYNEPLNASTLTTSNVFLQLNGVGTVASTPGLDATGTVIRIVPTAALQANKQYCYYVQAGVQGTNGLAAQQRGQCFTTGAGPQTTAPVVSLVSPVNQLSNVPVNANIRVLFSGPVDPLTVNDSTIQVMAAGNSQTISFGSGNQVVQITPQNPLPASTQLTLKVSGVKDVAGNVVPTSTTTFTTGAVPDLYTPVVVSANPPANATNVPLNAALSLQTNAAIDPTSVSTGTFGVYDNVLAVYVSGTYSFNASGTIVYFVPSAPLATGRTYTVNFASRGMTDLIGNLIGTCCSINNFSFTTGVVSSTTGPQVTGVSPASGLTQMPINAQVVIQFNEPVDALSVGQITLSAGGAPVNVSSYLTNGNQTFVMVPLGTLSPNTTYTVTIAGVTDISGLFPINPMVTSAFTTGTGVDFVAPSVTSAAPANGTTGVARSSTIQVQFNKQMDPLTITNSTFVVSVSGGGIVAGTVSVAAGARSATFTPQTALSASTVYVVQLNGGATDLVGQGLSSYQVSFTTGN